MKITNNIEEIREIIKEQKFNNKKIGFVPTMGALHEGHLSLVKESKKYSDFNVMSIFVNRIQFNEKSDFEKYPIQIKHDSKLAEESGIDLLFIPDESIIYDNQKTFVNVNDLTETLCGAHRPGHFEGVFTVVSKFFNIVQPDFAVFGQKDIQQAISIEKMTADLNFPLKIIIAPIIRDSDGIALSSRNVQLSISERQRALCLVNSLKKCKELLLNGVHNAAELKDAMKNVISETGNPEKLDYISIVDYMSLHEISEIKEKSVIAVAAYFGDTRLIDNMIINTGDKLNCIY